MGGIWTRPCIIWNRTSLQSVRRCSNVRHWRSSNIPLTLLVLWWRFSVHRAVRDVGPSLVGGWVSTNYTCMADVCWSALRGRPKFIVESVDVVVVGCYISVVLC